MNSEESKSESESSSTPQPISAPPTNSSFPSVPIEFDEQSFGAIASSSSLWVGATPSPEALRAFGEIDETFPVRLMDHADREQAHRHAREMKAIEPDSNVILHAASGERRGQYLAFGSLLVVVVTGLTLTLQGHPAVGALLFVPAVFAIIGAFIRGRSASLVSVESERPSRSDSS